MSEEKKPTAKEYLSQVFTLDSLIKAKRDQIAEMRTLQTSVSVALDPGKAKSAPGHDKLGDLGAAVLDMIDLYAVTLTRYLRLKYDIALLIEKVERNDYKQLLSLRYESLMKFDEVADEMGYSYYHVVHRLHPSALKEIEKML